MFILAINTQLKLQRTGELFTPGVDSKTLYELGLLGEGIALPNLGKNYKVFVESKGSGARHLACGTSLLYDHGEQVKSSMTIKNIATWLVIKFVILMMTLSLYTSGTISAAEGPSPDARLLRLF